MTTNQLKLKVSPLDDYEVCPLCWHVGILHGYSKGCKACGGIAPFNITQCGCKIKRDLRTSVHCADSTRIGDRLDSINSKAQRKTEGKKGKKNPSVFFKPTKEKGGNQHGRKKLV